MELSASAGSTGYQTTWKRLATPSGRLLWEHTARAHRTSASASTGPLTGYPTPNTMDTLPPMDYGTRLNHPSRPGRTVSGNLREVVVLTGWRTPMASDAKQQKAEAFGEGSNLFRQAPLAGYPTPTACDTRGVEAPNKGGKPYLSAVVMQTAGWKTPAACDGEGGALDMIRDTNPHFPLRDMAAMSGWSSPTASDGEGGTKAPKEENTFGLRLRDASLLAGTSTHGGTLSEHIASIIKSARLNPAFSRWLQGFPVAWDTAAILAHRNMRTTRRKPSPCASKDTATPST